ncbi:glycoside hydrolase family 2 TIM barrel-domain containing protein [Aquimarina litoralis]|uniref:glycoside hydrolase family 2 TIM barrel-domain containing protein n=1 Tax=Aquimarina litoralis TaxID=584605 RepID=UPI001C5A5366|nr:glycoside hydrolase family 2 TIM barrel-domain containing protein [Aquimarina litoralis]
MKSYTKIMTLTFFICFSLFQNNGKIKAQEASKVVVKQIEGVYKFYVNDKKFDLKGVGINYVDGHDFEALHQAGGNAFRTWGTKNVEKELEAAKKYGFMVALGISLGKELWGFDYNDEEAVAKQLKKVKSIVKKYKDHPNVLCWVLGNELNLLFNEDGSLKKVNPKVYDAVSEMVDYIHKEDLYHPVTTTFAGVIEDHLEVALKRLPQLDIISVQVYGDLERVEELMKNTGISKPYMITEFGPRGFWEMPKTDWNREIEEVSGPKADGILNRMEKGLIGNTSGKCLGGFAFEWGQKQERTPTWYGMFHKDGSQTETIDNLTKLWTGNYPKNRAPRVDSIMLNGKKSVQNIKLKPNQKYTSKVYAYDHDGDTLTYKWVISKEVDIRSQGGEKEIEPATVDVKIIENDDAFTFITPEEGEYRIFAYVYDGKGKAGGGNIPFLVAN